MKKYSYNKRDKMFSDNSLMINYRGNPPIEKDIIYLVDIEELKKESPVVYGCPLTDKPDWNGHGVYNWNADQMKKDVYKGYVAFIEPIEKKECNHSAEVYRNTWNDTGPRYIIDVDKMKCAYCGIELIPEWKEKK